MSVLNNNNKAGMSPKAKPVTWSNNGGEKNRLRENEISFIEEQLFLCEKFSRDYYHNIFRST